MGITLYGDQVVILFQNFVIILLIWMIDKNISLVEKVGYIAVTASFVYVIFEGSIMTEELWASVATFKIVVNIASRLPQIWTNFKA